MASFAGSRQGQALMKSNAGDISMVCFKLGWKADFCPHRDTITGQKCRKRKNDKSETGGGSRFGFARECL
jgi:hypothetical protein